jgi:short-subunit dehydrogenase
VQVQEQEQALRMFDRVATLRSLYSLTLYSGIIRNLHVSLVSSRAFAATHHLALISRSQPTLDKTASTLPPNATSHPFLADSSDPKSLEAAWSKIKETWPEGIVDVAVFNAPGGKFSPGGFLDKDVNDLKTGLQAGV